MEYNDIKNGQIVTYKGQIWKVYERYYEHQDDGTCVVLNPINLNVSGHDYVFVSTENTHLITLLDVEAIPALTYLELHAWLWKISRRSRSEESMPQTTVWSADQFLRFSVSSVEFPGYTEALQTLWSACVDIPLDDAALIDDLRQASLYIAQFIKLNGDVADLALAQDRYQAALGTAAQGLHRSGTMNFTTQSQWAWCVPFERLHPVEGVELLTLYVIHPGSALRLLKAELGGGRDEVWHKVLALFIVDAELYIRYRIAFQYRHRESSDQWWLLMSHPQAKRRYVQKIAIPRWQGINRTFLIGSDPELVCYKGDNQITVEGTDHLPDGEIGTDHGHAVIELRPNAGTPVSHSAHSTRLLQQLVGWANEHRLTLYATNTERNPSLGGHIHIGVGERIRDAQARRIVANLDYWLALTVLPLFPATPFRRRHANGYGHLSNWRMQPHGIEYRTLPNFYLSPAIILGVFTLAHTIVELTIAGKMVVRDRPNDLRWVDAYARHNLTKTADIREAKVCSNRSIPGSRHRPPTILFTCDPPRNTEQYTNVRHLGLHLSAPPPSAGTGTPSPLGRDRSGYGCVRYCLPEPSREVVLRQAGRSARGVACPESYASRLAP